MTHRLLKSVAVAALLIAGATAHAQSPGGAAGGAAGGAPSASPSAPAGGGMGGAAPGSGASNPASERGAPGGGAMNRDPGSAGGNMARDRADDQRGGAMNRNADDRNAPGNTQRDAQSPKDKADNPRAADGKNAKTGTTTGSAPAGKMTDEQRTRVTTVIKQQKVQPVTNVNFSISVGTRVPREVGFHPLPPQLITIYPDWRGYEFFLVRDEIVIVNPRTLEIVAVIPA